MKHLTSKRRNLDETPNLRGQFRWMKHLTIHVVKEHVVKEQVVGTAGLLKNGTATKQPKKKKGPL